MPFFNPSSNGVGGHAEKPAGFRNRDSAGSGSRRICHQFCFLHFVAAFFGFLFFFFASDFFIDDKGGALVGGDNKWRALELLGGVFGVSPGILEFFGVPKQSGLFHVDSPVTVLK